jgi:26S proteasome regulatory subunit N6
MGDKRAVTALKYILLCRVALGQAEEVVAAATTGKYAVAYAGPELEAMRAVAEAARRRSLQEFEAALAAHRAVLGDDPLVVRHVAHLGETMLEKNLTRLVEPFACVEVDHVAELIKLPRERVEAKLAEMILDKKLAGTLDAGRGQLRLFDAPPSDGTYGAALDAVKAMNAVLDALFKRAEQLR